MRVYLRNALLVGIVISLGLAGGAFASDIDESAGPFIEWAKKHAQPLKTAKAGSGFDDLQGLRDIVGDARVVAIGESEHYIGEFFAMKHRMIEFLVEEMGFTAVTLEAGFGDAAVLHDYVSICTSSATSASVMCPKNTIGTPTCTPI